MLISMHYEIIQGLQVQFLTIQFSPSRRLFTSSWEYVRPLDCLHAFLDLLFDIKLIHDVIP